MRSTAVLLLKCVFHTFATDPPFHFNLCHPLAAAVGGQPHIITRSAVSCTQKLYRHLAAAHAQRNIQCDPCTLPIAKLLPTAVGGGVSDS